MKRFSTTALWGIVSVGIYVAVILAIFVYFNFKRHDQTRRYVKKNDDTIQIALAAPQKPTPSRLTPTRKAHKKPVKKTLPKKTKVKKKPSSKPKKQSAKKVRTKRLAIKKPAKRVKKRDVNRTRHSKPKSAKSLFASVKTPKKPHIRVTDKPIRAKPAKQLFEMVDAPPLKDAQHSMKKQKRKEKGVENAYLAKVQRMLEDWPSQSDFAGEKVKVYLKIRPSGYFDFEFKQKANNPAFNEALRAYLEQLQTIGFGPHKGGRTYVFEAEFIAKE